MKNLMRALRMTLKYRWSLVTSFICSLLVAMLWSLNLGAVYPFVEIVLHGHSLHDWAEQQQTTIDEQVAKHQFEIAALESKLQSPDISEDEVQQVEIEKQIVVHRYDIETQTAHQSALDRMLPYIERWAPPTPFSTLAWLMILMLIGTLLRGLFLVGSVVSVARVGQRTVLDLQNRVFQNVLDMEPSELTVNGTGDLVGRIRGETSIIGTAVMTLFGKVVREPLKMIGCMVGAGLVNWRLLLFSLLVCPIAGYLMVLLASVTKKANKRALEESAKLMNRLFQSVTYMRVVRAFNMQDHERLRFRKTAEDVYRRSMRISWFSSFARVNTELLGVGMMTLSVLAGGYLVLNQQTHLFGIRMCDAPMNFGAVMMFFGFLIGISDPLRKMGDVYNRIQGGFVAADRVFPLLDQRPAVTSPPQAKAIPAGPLAITLDAVRFEYEPNTPILRGVSADIPAGTSLAIVGQNGCGKSTLINLLPRFFDTCTSEPDQSPGAIRIAGIDVRDLNPHDVRANIGYVTQTTMLFNDSVADNIAYGTSNATREQILAAAKQAHAHEFIMALERGYDTNIGEQGGKLSGGQRQRLSLARAILKNPRILILDEATSQIDPESKELIHDTLAEFIQGRTAVIITHRMSTLQLVDRILLLRDGQVVDCGTHAQLLSRCPEYQRMQNVPLEEAA